MGTTKKHFYNEEQLKFSNLCRALGHPARIKIVELLSRNNHLNCSGLQSEIKLSLQTVSQHCRILHENGILGYEVINSNCFYRLNTDVLHEINNFIDAINITPTPLTSQVYYPANRP